MSGNVYLEITFESTNIDLSILTQITGLNPTSIIQNGDITRSGKILDYGQWVYRGKLRKVDYVEELFIDFLKLFTDSLSHIQELQLNSKLETTICIVIKDHDEVLPSLTLTPSFINFASSLDATIDFDGL